MSIRWGASFTRLPSLYGFLHSMSLLNAGRVSRKRDNGFIGEIFSQIAQIAKGVRKKHRCIPLHAESRRAAVLQKPWAVGYAPPYWALFFTRIQKQQPMRLTAHRLLLYRGW